jgi:hypothetical protein
VYACNPSSRRLRQEGREFKDSLGHIARPCLQKQKQNKTKITKCHLVSPVRSLYTSILLTQKNKNSGLETGLRGDSPCL